MTHFATADGDLEFAARQLEQFRPFVAEARALATTDITRPRRQQRRDPAGPRKPLRHGPCRDRALRRRPDEPRPGRPRARAGAGAAHATSPPSSRSPPGQSTGYGRHFIAERDSQIATLPIGYGDGVVRALANNCDVLIGGRRYPLCGMVSMDNITVDVGPDPAVAAAERAR